MEQWKILDFEKGYENFSVSNTGKIKNNRTGTILKPNINNMGYEKVNLYNKITKKQRKFFVHRLVALYFSEGDKTLIVNHIDGNKRNNHVSNLEWVTYSENNSHAYRTGLKNENGEKNPFHKYNEKQIRSICELLETNLTRKEISKKVFNSVDKRFITLIGNIFNKKRWTHISSEYNF